MLLMMNDVSDVPRVVVMMAFRSRIPVAVNTALYPRDIFTSVHASAA